MPLPTINLISVLLLIGAAQGLFMALTSPKPFKYQQLWHFMPALYYLLDTVLSAQCTSENRSLFR